FELRQIGESVYRFDKGLLKKFAGDVPRSYLPTSALYIEIAQASGAGPAKEAGSERYAVGHAAEVSVTALRTVQTEIAEFTPYLNNDGWLTVSIDARPRPNVTVINEGLVVTDGVLQLQ